MYKSIHVANVTEFELVLTSNLRINIILVEKVTQFYFEYHFFIIMQHNIGTETNGMKNFYIYVTYFCQFQKFLIRVRWQNARPLFYILE